MTSKNAAWKRPMKGFTKITFDDDVSTACSRGMQADAGFRASSIPAALPCSPALSARSAGSTVLSVSLDAAKSPTFTFEPWSGCGNTEPPPFSLGGPSSLSSDGEPSPGKRFDGGSPTWIFHGWSFALSPKGEALKDVKLLIERHSGTISRCVGPACHMLVATEGAVKRNTARVRHARARGLPIVTPGFVRDSIKAGEAFAYQAASYLPSEPVQRTCFAWRRAIRKRLKAAEGGVLRRRVLRSAVLTDHVGHLEDAGDAVNAAWWRARPVEAKLHFRQMLRKARMAGKVETEGKLVRVVR